MSALEFLFLGDATWQAHRIANSVDSLRRQAAFQHGETVSALDRIARLQDEQLSLSRQRLELMERLSDDEARRRNVTGALVLHESELDRLVEARNALEKPTQSELALEGRQELAEFARSLDVSAAMRARMLLLGLAFSGITIGDMPSIVEQKQFLAIQQKAETEWSGFCRGSGQAMIDQVEFAALSALCEMRIQDHAYLACAYAAIAADPELIRCFDGSMRAEANAAAQKGTGAIAGWTALGTLLGAPGGALLGILMSFGIMQGGGWNILHGVLALFILTPLGWWLGAVTGEAVGGGTSRHVVMAKRHAGVEAVGHTWTAGVERAVDLATTRFVESIGTRLTYQDPSHARYRQWLAGLAPEGWRTMWEQSASFWSRLVQASPAARRLAPFDAGKQVLYDGRAVDVLVAVIRSREALSR